MAHVSLSLIEQSLITGILAGGLYGLLALGLSLSWGLLRLVNLGHFAIALLGAYLTWWMGTALGIAPWWAGLMIIAAFFVYGIGLHWVFMRFAVTEMASMLITFAFAVIVESALQFLWTADFRRYETAWGTQSWVIGSLYVPKLSFIAFLVACALAGATWAWLGAALRRLGKSRSYQPARATLRSLLGAQPVRIVSKRLPTLPRVIAMVQITRGARYMCGRDSLSAVFLANE